MGISSLIHLTCQFVVMAMSWCNKMKEDISVENQDTYVKIFSAFELVSLFVASLDDDFVNYRLKVIK